MATDTGTGPVAVVVLVACRMLSFRPAKLNSIIIRCMSDARGY